ncbi:MAG: U32 family peptidase [Erysipelotrichaceae bacterium]|nr:U32 family peptidase [Erysipelotrichaceae bacterium]
MKKVELLAPAKDLSKAKIAIDYGADAVYVGGQNFSLRSRASNFTYEDLREIVEYAHQRKKKVYVTVNMVFHDEDLCGFREYVRYLESIETDALIISSLALMQLVKKIAPRLECHISTQLSTMSSAAVKALKSLGADRVVLGRECSMEEIEDTARNVDTELEVFIHGGMCSNYSGRCVLSNRMTLRDANRGGCAHSCRWKYRLYDNGKPVFDDNCLLSFSSKDLRASAYLERMIKCGIASLKIEGRMKSEYYIAQVVKTYRRMIDEIYEKGELDATRLAYYDNELSKAENRLADDGLLSGNCGRSKHLYGVNGAGVTHDYVAYVLDYDKSRNLAKVVVKNRFMVNDELEVFGPAVDNESFINKLMFDEDMVPVDLANKPTQILYLRLPIEVHAKDMIRKAHHDN